MRVQAEMRDIQLAVKDGRAFSIRAEFVGSNEKNASGRSRKYWSIERHLDGAPIQIRFGRIGTYGQVRNVGVSFGDALDTLRQKERKGYRVTSKVVNKAPEAKPVEAPKPVQRPNPVLVWASALPAPFNTIQALDPTTGEAFNAMGVVVCTMPIPEVTRILAELADQV